MLTNSANIIESSPATYQLKHLKFNKLNEIEDA